MTSISSRSVYIVILNWNGWADTLSCLASLDDLDYPNRTVIVVDNASTDDSVSRIKRVRPDLWLHVNDENLGFGRGCNVGIRLALDAGADYVWLLNNDTVVSKESLSHLVSAAESDHRIGAVGSVLRDMQATDVVQAWGGGRINYFLGAATHCLTPQTKKPLHYLTAASVLLTKSCLQKIQGFDDDFFMYWEDVDLSFRISKAGWLLKVEDKAIIFHKENASLGKNNIRLQRYFNTSAIIFFQKHYRFSLLPIVLGTSGRIIKRLLARDLKGSKAILEIFALSIFSKERN